MYTKAICIESLNKLKFYVRKSSLNFNLKFANIYANILLKFDFIISKLKNKFNKLRFNKVYLYKIKFTIDQIRLD